MALSNEYITQIGQGVPGPGPAGPGVIPHAVTGNAGRPNFTYPDPTQAARDKNFYQDQSSRPATSPSIGTSGTPAPPEGGQRGQEWYGKGPSPYGQGRRKKMGIT